jgi:hypothetical protein
MNPGMPNEKPTLDYVNRPAKPWTEEGRWIPTVYFPIWLSTMILFALCAISILCLYLL